MLLDFDLSRFSVTRSEGFAAVGDLSVAYAGYCHGAQDLPEKDQSAAIAGSFRREGPEFTRALLGQYAAILVDPGGRRVVLAQDSLGLGRLSFGLVGDRLVAGSDAREVAALLSAKALDEGFFTSLIATGRRPERRTPFAGVEELSYGDTCVITARGVTRLRPWRPQRGTIDLSQPEAEEILRRKIDLAVARTMPEAGVTMIELSGGLDSSTVAATAAGANSQVELLSYLSERGMSGNDAKFARIMAKTLGCSWHRLDPDIAGIVNRPCEVLHPEPGSRLYSAQLEDIAALIGKQNAQVVLTGAGGDIVFDYRGLVPVYLADPLVRGRLIKTLRAHQGHAREYGGNRAWTHRLRYVTLPYAAMFVRGQNMITDRHALRPDWLAIDARQVQSETPPAKTHAPGLAVPSQVYLWDHLFALAFEENRTFSQMQPVPVFHPLLDRELAEFLIALPKDIRRGVTGDRGLQRRALADRLPPEIAARKTKGSNTEMRERHLLESESWYQAMTKAPQIVSRGWVVEAPWRHAIDCARAGAPKGGPNFAAAMECELWLQDYERLGLAAFKRVPG